jgi:hypothetical protein
MPCPRCVRSDGDHLGTRRLARTLTTCTVTNGPHRALPLMTCRNG